MNRRLRWLVGAALVAAALLGHLVYWYLPRSHPGTVDPDSPAGELFLSSGREVRLWFAHPHQSLGAAAGAMDDPGAVLAAAARLAGLREIELPSFGPFALPPSNALAVAVDGEGDRLAVAVAVYPTVAAVARLAGLVAGNPVLEGGATTVGGRQVVVRWSGRHWSMTEEGGPPVGGARTRAVAGEALAWVALERGLGPVAAGTYRLRRERGDLVLGSAPEESGWSAAAELAETGARGADLAFLGLRATGADDLGVLVMPRAGVSGGLRLPDSAAAWTSGSARWSLPGERVLRLLGLDLEEDESGGWRFAAIDRRSLEVAEELAPALGERARAAGVRFLLWVRPRDYLPLVSTVAGVLDAIPFAPEREVARWRDLETLLRGLGPAERLRAVVAAGGAEARLDWTGAPSAP